MVGNVPGNKPTNRTTKAAAATAKAGIAKAKTTNNTPKKTAATKTDAKDRTPREPKKPTPKEITVTITSGDNLGYLAEKYHTSVKEIQKLNNIKDPSKLKEGQKIKIMAISEQDYKAYQEKLTKYYQQKYEIEQKKEVQRKKEKANALIEQAKKDGRDEDYAYAINYKTGNIVVTLKNNRNMGRIKEDFNLPPGSISSTNNMEKKFGKIPTYDNGSRSFETWDAIEVKKGTTLEINTDHFKTERTWKKAWKDFWN